MSLRSFDYVDVEGRPTTGRVEPHGLLVQPPVWYVLGRDVEKNAPRTFRMDRISRPRLLSDVAFIPDADVIWSQLPAECTWYPLLKR